MTLTDFSWFNEENANLSLVPDENVLHHDYFDTHLRMRSIHEQSSISSNEAQSGDIYIYYFSIVVLKEYRDDRGRLYAADYSC